MKQQKLKKSQDITDFSEENQEIFKNIKTSQIISRGKKDYFK